MQKGSGSTDRDKTEEGECERRQDVDGDRGRNVGSGERKRAG